MKLTVLGNRGAYPKAGTACSGYLLETKQGKIVLDLGAGTLANLLSVCKIEDVSAIVLTHLHWDHFSDMMVLQYALEDKHLTIPVYCPAEPAVCFNLLNDCPFFDVTPITEGLSLPIGDVTLDFTQLSHGVPDFGVRVTEGGFVFGYTGDTAMCGALDGFLAPVQTLLCDTTFLDDVDSDKHLSVMQAIDAAQRNGVRRLIMTHFPAEARSQAYLDKARDRFNGRMSMTDMMQVIQL